MLLGVSIVLRMKSSSRLLRHMKCINAIYPKSEVQRFPVPEDKVSWDEEFTEYAPVFYESPALAGKEWADPSIGENQKTRNRHGQVAYSCTESICKINKSICVTSLQSNLLDRIFLLLLSDVFQPKFNELDDKIDRRSHTGEYKVRGGCPFNPVGRTGIIGRGLLGRWGVNHAADPVVSRWKRTPEGDVVNHPSTQK